MPAVLGVVAVAMSFIMPEIDSRVEDELTRHSDWLFFGTADSARSILSAISSSLITVITLLFSITMLTLQQAATQYTPRIIRAFMNDRGVQIVLAVFLATFLYSLLVLRQVRGETTVGGSTLSASVPMLSVSLAILLTMVCLALLIYFIHHSATIFQASTIVERIHHEVLDSIDQLYPENIGSGAGEAPTIDEFRSRYTRQPGVLVRADTSGYLRRVDDDAIMDALDDGGWGIVIPRTGAYVTHRQPLMEVNSDSAGDDDQIRRFQSAFVLDRERTLAQDELFGIRQLVDIALKALSPSIHDPTTAEHVISCLGDILIVLSDREFPSPTRIIDPDDTDGRANLWINRPDFAAFVETAFGQIRRTARDDLHVSSYLLDVLTALERQTSGERGQVVSREIDRLMWQIDQSEFDPDAKQRLREKRTTDRLGWA
jgi:uncharacterized membrane protein